MEEDDFDTAGADLEDVLAALAEDRERTASEEATDRLLAEMFGS
jgi:hypothetical protein